MQKTNYLLRCLAWSEAKQSLRPIHLAKSNFAAFGTAILILIIFIDFTYDNTNFFIIIMIITIIIFLTSVFDFFPDKFSGSVAQGRLSFCNECGSAFRIQSTARAPNVHPEYRYGAAWSGNNTENYDENPGSSAILSQLEDDLIRMHSRLAAEVEDGRAFHLAEIMQNLQETRNELVIFFFSVFIISYISLFVCNNGIIELICLGSKN
jgi:hypothetical protein